jgi:hypothetical protein
MVRSFAPPKEALVPASSVTLEVSVLSARCPTSTRMRSPLRAETLDSVTGLIPAAGFGQLRFVVVISSTVPVRVSKSKSTPRTDAPVLVTTEALIWGWALRLVEASFNFICPIRVPVMVWLPTSGPDRKRVLHTSASTTPLWVPLVVEKVVVA